MKKMILCSRLKDSKLARKAVEYEFSQLFDNRIVDCNRDNPKDCPKGCQEISEKLEEKYNMKVKIFPAINATFDMVAGLVTGFEEIKSVDVLVGCLKRADGKKRFVTLNKRRIHII